MKGRRPPCSSAAGGTVETRRCGWAPFIGRRPHTALEHDDREHLQCAVAYVLKRHDIEQSEVIATGVFASLWVSGRLASLRSCHDELDESLAAEVELSDDRPCHDERDEPLAAGVERLDDWPCDDERDEPLGAEVEHLDDWPRDDDDERDEPLGAEVTHLEGWHDGGS